MSRNEQLLTAILNGTSVSFEPMSRAEAYLKACCNGTGTDGIPAPQSRNDALLYQLADKLSSGGNVISWDGNITGKTVSAANELCLVSDKKLTLAQAQSATVTMSDDTVYTGEALTIAQDGGLIYATAGGIVVFAVADGYTELNDGTWLHFMASGTYTKKLEWV